MQGVGKNAGPSTLFYGSVHDESGQPATLETKIKKRYWETKQSLIEKLGKDQDEHFVADDADIDLRVQVSDDYHRKRLCSVHALQRCSMYIVSELCVVFSRTFAVDTGVSCACSVRRLHWGQTGQTCGQCAL